MANFSIGLFADGYFPAIDGVTIAVQNYAHWLTAAKHPCCIITPKIPGRKITSEFPVYSYLSLPIFQRKPYRIGLSSLDIRLHNFLQKKKFSIIHAHTPFSAGRLGLQVAKKSKIPIIATIHTKYKDDLIRVVKNHWLVDRIIHKMISFLCCVDQVWVPQKGVIAILRDYGFKGNIEVVENGIDYSPVTNVQALWTKGNSYLSLNSDCKLGLFVGQHIYEKNIEFLLNSLPKIIKSIPNFKMLFVGDGYAKKNLVALANRLTIDNKVIFHPPIYDRDLLAILYARADIFLFPSLYDNAPLVIREAAAFETPSLLLQNSVAAEVITNNENGFLVKEDNDTFSHLVVDLLSKPQLLKQVALGAKKSLCKNWQQVAEEVRIRYEDLINDKSSKLHRVSKS